MPSISQLPPAHNVASNDEIPMSQNGSACAVSVGDLLASVQPAINVPSPSLIGRKSVGSGGPEPILLGTGIELADGRIAATGADHAAFSRSGDLIVDSDLVVSDNGRQKLMPTASLRNLFSAGANIAIDTTGVISAATSGEAVGVGFPIDGLDSLPQVAELSANSLIPSFRHSHG